MGLPHKGKPKSAEHRAKIGLAGLRRPPPSEETRLKMSKSAKLRIAQMSKLQFKERMQKLHAGAARREPSIEELTKRSISAKRRIKLGIFGFAGRKHTEATKYKMRMAHFRKEQQ